MSDPTRQLERTRTVRQTLDYLYATGDPMTKRSYDSILAALSTTPAPGEPEWPALANDIRAVDGNHDLGAGALAEALIERGWTRRRHP